MKVSKAVELTADNERLVYAMNALGDKTRFKMFKLMLEDSEMCVSEIAEALNVSAPAISQHFKTFELIGLVDKERNGQKICYAIKRNDKLVSQLEKIINR